VSKWLSPDPIGLAGQDANLYRYVSGNPVIQLDPSGLLLGRLPKSCFPDYQHTYKEVCPCGPDATGAVQGVLNDITAYFRSIPVLYGYKGKGTKQRMLCTDLYNVLTGWKAWDISPLLWSSRTGECGACNDDLHDPDNPGTQEDPSKQKPCAFSVWIKGGCHCAGFVNYLAFGRMNRLCYDFYDNDSDYNTPNMLHLISLWKEKIYGDSRGAAFASEWATIGWHDSLNSNRYPATPTKKQCQYCRDKKGKPVLEDMNYVFNWYPWHPYPGQPVQP